MSEGRNPIRANLPGVAGVYRPWGLSLVDEGYRIFNLTILWEIRHDAMVRGALRQLRQILR